MSTSRLADSRIRAASSQAVGLDVRGPVSRALARTGVEIPPARLAGETDPTTPDTSARPTSAAPSTKSPRRTGVRAARRVVKPFADAPWPTQRPKAVPKAAPDAVLSGLTADEHRVHRILLDSLARANTLDGVSDGLTYVEKKRLAALDLTYIDAEIARMKVRPSISGLRWLLVTLATGVGLPLLAMGDVGSLTDKLAFLVIGMLCAVGVLRGAHKPNGHAQRLAIYEALRELALVADPDDVTSDALQQADAVIDRLAANDAPRLRLDDAPVSTASSAALRLRTRS